ncbi:MAG: efflux RND transporter periplasmic adaptor subunit [Pirellulaceae bacterium]|nr:efflux RND transporter periplasmic adaptor subunit [Pirellulaceae bacterium]
MMSLTRNMHTRLTSASSLIGILLCAGSLMLPSQLFAQVAVDVARDAATNLPDEKSDGTPAAPANVELLQVNNAILKTIESTTIAAQASGIIDSILVKEGHRVKVGQELGRIRDAGVRLQVERAKAAMDVAKRKQQDDIDERLAKKSKAVAENEYQRAVAANARVSDTYPVNEIDRLKLVADRSGLEVERATYLRSMASLEAVIAETEYRQALEVQERHRLVCPVAGIVVSIEKHVGEWVEPGVALLKIERMDRLRVEGFVSAADSMQNLAGRPASVEFSSAAGTVQAKGTVVFVSPSIDPIASTARVFIEIANADNQFRPGLGVRATIHLQP